MKKKHGRSWSIIFLCCLLAVPTLGAIMGMYGPSPTLTDLRPALLVGAALGVMHILLRPLLRILTAPLGCLTFGLFGMVIDVGLLYASAALVDGFSIPGLPYAILAALTINAVCAIAGGKH